MADRAAHAARRDAARSEYLDPWCSAFVTSPPGADRRGFAGGGGQRRDHRPRCCSGQDAVRDLQSGMQSDGRDRCRDGLDAVLVSALLVYRRSARRLDDQEGGELRSAGPRRHSGHHHPRLAATRLEPGVAAVRTWPRHCSVHVRSSISRGCPGACRGSRDCRACQAARDPPRGAHTGLDVEGTPRRWETTCDHQSRVPQSRHSSRSIQIQLCHGITLRRFGIARLCRSC